MAAKVWIGIRTRAQFLRRLSVVFAVELRLKIVTELYMREMSPKGFYEEFGGGSIPRVDKNFKRLSSEGWLRYVRSAPGKNGRGVEHFYRATELAFCDADTWAMLPYSIRVAFSWNAFKQIAQRLREAIEASTFDARPDRHLTNTQLMLDQQGWERSVDAVSNEFVAQFEEQEDSRRRVSHSGEELIRASSVLMLFESPRSADGHTGPPPLVENCREPLVPFPLRLSKVFADPVCIQIVQEANKRPISAPVFHAEFGGDTIEGIRRRFKKLAEIGWLRVVERKTGGRRRSAVELFYRATGPAILKEHGPWTGATDFLRETSGWTIFERLTGQVKEAMVTGTFDGREDRVLAWSILALDQQGWGKVTASVETLLTFLLKEQERAKARMARSGEEPILVTIVLGAFESPLDSVKEP